MLPVVTERVVWSVGRSLTVVSPAKTAEPIEMSFGLRSREGPSNHVLDWCSDDPMRGAVLGERGTRVKYRDRSRCCFGFGLGWATW